MAKLKVFVLKDVRTGAFMNPVFVQNRAVLERSLSDAKRDENSLLSWHPEDYQAYSLGEYDQDTGKLDCGAPEHLFNLEDLKDANE